MTGGRKKPQSTVSVVISALFVIESAAALAQSAGTFTPAGSMTTTRSAYSATLLPSGKVLIAGGYTPSMVHAVLLVALDPQNSSTLYAVAQLLDDNGVSLFKSTDGAASWNPAGLAESHIDSLAIDPQNSSTLYAGTDQGVFKTIDGGMSWKPVNSRLPSFPVAPNGTVASILIDPLSPGVVYAAVASDYGGRIFKSTNGGGSWSDASSGLIEKTLVRPLVGPVLVIDPGIPTTLYTGTTAGVFKSSTDGGTSWAPANSGLLATRITDIAVTPGNSSTLYAVTSGGLFKTTGGGMWSRADSGLAAVYSPLAIDLQNTSTIFAGGCTTPDRICGIVKSADGGTSWSISEILVDPSSSLTALTIDPQNSNTVYATAQEFDECGTETLYKTVDGGMSWSHSLFSDMGVSANCVLALAVDSRNSNNLYAAFQYGGVFKSTDAGATWNAANSGLSANNAEALAIDPANPGTVYTVSSAGVYKSGDGAISWQPASSGLPDWSGTTGDCCFRPRLAIDPQNSARLYLGIAMNGAQHVFQSSDGGASWTDSLAVSGCCLWFGGLAISSQGPGTVYAGSPGEGVFAFRPTARATKSPSQ